MPTDPIQRAKATYFALRQRIRTTFMDETDEELQDTVDGESVLPELLGRLIRSADNDAGNILWNKDRIGELEERNKRLLARHDKKRDIVAEVMQDIDRTKLEYPDMTVSLSRRSGKVIVTDETKIPSEYMRVPDPPRPKPDLHGIKAALDKGDIVPGAELSNASFSLTVRKS